KQTAFFYLSICKSKLYKYLVLLIFVGLWASFSFSQQLIPLILTIDEPQIGDSVSQLQIINPNPNDTYVYSFGTDSAVNATFELDSLTGVFWIKNNTWMDADLHSQINFGVSAKVLGSGIYTFNALVTINLIDIQEPI